MRKVLDALLALVGALAAFWAFVPLHPKNVPEC
jgi:hypothetical protein